MVFRAPTSCLIEFRACAFIVLMPEIRRSPTQFCAHESNVRNLKFVAESLEGLLPHSLGLGLRHGLLPGFGIIVLDR
jgi:hypothetical protein